MDIDIDAYLRDNPLDESLVLSLDVNLDREEVVIIYSYAAEAVSHYFATGTPLPYRDFRKLVFYGVRALEATSFRSRRNAVALDILRDRIANGAICVVGVDVSRKNSLHRVDLDITDMFSLSIEFESASVERRLGRGVKDESRGEWRYYDAETGAEFGFERPFG